MDGVKDLTDLKPGRKSYKSMIDLEPIHIFSDFRTSALDNSI
jgi:hypothetical protein